MQTQNHSEQSTSNHQSTFYFHYVNKSNFHSYIRHSLKIYKTYKDQINDLFKKIFN